MTSPESRNLTRRRVVVITVLVIWASLLALGLSGQSAAIPRVVTVPAGLIALVPLIFLIPVWALYGLVRERRIGKSSSYQIWIRWRWQFAVAGGPTTLIAGVLLFPLAHETIQLKLVGTVALIWGVLCLWDAGLAFRAKARVAAPKSNR